MTSPQNEGRVGHSGAVVRDSAVISLFNGLGVLGGLGLDMVVAALFGLGQATDAFFLAFTVPQFLTLVAQGSYISALVPVLAGLRQGDERRVWNVFSALLNLNGILWVALAALGWGTSGWITALISAGLDPTAQAEAVVLTRILFLMLPPLGLAEVMRSQLNAMGSFALPAAANVLRYLGALATLWAGHRSGGIQSLAAGYVIGAWMQAGMLAVGVAAAGVRYRFSLGLRDPDVRDSMRLFFTRAFGFGLRRTGLLFERFLGSYLPAGSVTALSYARRVSLSLYQVFANSVNAAILPDLSQSVQLGDQAALRRSLRLGFRLLGFVTSPAAALMAGLGVPLVRVLFQRGAFSTADTTLTAGLLAIYVLNVPALALVQVLLAPHYARRDAATPTRHMAWILGVNVLLAWGLMRIGGVHGLAWSSTIAAIVSAGRAYWLLRRREALSLGWYTARVVAASAAAGLAGWGGWQLCRSIAPLRGTVGALVFLLAASAGGVLVYLGVGQVLRLNELPLLLQMLRKPEARQVTESV